MKTKVLLLRLTSFYKTYIYKTYIKYVYVYTYLYVCMLGKKMQTVWNDMLQSMYKEKFEFFFYFLWDRTNSTRKLL